MATVPLGRVGEPEEIAGAAVFFASSNSRLISGTIVDGGQVQI
jgi:NAD(P)-dependent dehydrogenase (short-subunit alcohol dehydrogenase family)